MSRETSGDVGCFFQATCPRPLGTDSREGLLQVNDHQTRRAHIYGIIWGYANVNKHAESEVECFSGVKTIQNSKTEGGVERKKKKHENVKLKEDVPGQFYLEKHQKNAS